MLAVRIASLFGAGRVVAAGRNQDVLSSLNKLSVDATIQFDAPAENLAQAFQLEGGVSSFQVVIDFVWGRPAETLLAAIARKEFAQIKGEIRYIQVGESAGPVISLPASVLRSTPLRILGTGGILPGDLLAGALQQVMTRTAEGELQVDTERVPLGALAGRLLR